MSTKKQISVLPERRVMAATLAAPVPWFPLKDWAFDVAVEINNTLELGLPDKDMQRAARIIMRNAKQRAAS
jgi:hypothetical protein